MLIVIDYLRNSAQYRAAIREAAYDERNAELQLTNKKGSPRNNAEAAISTFERTVFGTIVRYLPQDVQESFGNLAPGQRSASGFCRHYPDEETRENILKPIEANALRGRYDLNYVEDSENDAHKDSVENNAHSQEPHEPGNSTQSTQEPDSLFSPSQSLLEYFLNESSGPESEETCVPV